MKQTLLLLIFCVYSLSSMSQYNRTIGIASSANYVFTVDYDSLKSTYHTTAYMSNSIFYHKQISNMKSCDLYGKLPAIKQQIVEILISCLKQKVSNALQSNYRMTVFFLPKHNGEIADVWIRWAGKQRIFSTEELDKLFLKLKTIKINFNDLSATDTSYCQYLSFGILKKDWEYILNSTKGE